MINVLSLFSGAGGLDIGFSTAGFNIVASIEFEDVFCRTLESNVGKYFPKEHKTICADISTLSPEGLNLSKVDVIIGGPPCQSFSAAGRRAGGVYGINDVRGSLFYDFCRFIDYYNPSVFLFENVRGILQANKGADWQVIKSTFESLGYKISFRILDAADYGVPQHRERLILVGSRDKEFLFPKPTHGPDSVGEIPYITPGEVLKDIDVPDEVVPPYGGKYGDLLAEVPPGMNYLYFTEKMGHPEPKFAWRSRFSNFLYKADPNVPCKTIVASQGRYGGPFHWKGRKFTNQELKRLQSFPDDYEIMGSEILVSKQIGNSVAPLFASILAKSIMKQYFDNSKFSNIEFLSSEEILGFDSRKKIKAKATRKITTANSSSNQISIFDVEQLETKVVNLSMSEKLIYKNPRTIAEDNYKLNGTEYGIFNVNLVLDNGICKGTVKKSGDFSHPKAIVLNLKFDSPLAKSVQEIKLSLESDSLEDIFVLWDVIHLIVNKVSSYDDLQPLFGHFTEPYPKFKFHISSDDDEESGIVEFAKKASDYSYIKSIHPIDELCGLFGTSIDTSDEIVQNLRSLGYDVRVHEINRTIPEGYFKICYPFTLSKKNPVISQWIEKGMHKTADHTWEMKSEEKTHMYSNIPLLLDELLKELEQVNSADDINLPLDVKRNVESFSGKIDKARSAFVNIVTGLSVNLLDKEIDPRYHRPEKDEGMPAPPEGRKFYTGRSVSEKIIYPWLSKKGYRYAKSGWQTRTFERPQPYNQDYREAIGYVKEEFLNILHEVAEGRAESKSVLMYFFFLEEKIKLEKQKQVLLLSKRDKTNDALIKDIVKGFENHFKGAGSSRLPVLALYATYQSVLSDVKRYEGMFLAPLGEHSAADVRTNSTGDIEILNPESVAVESVEVKHDIMIEETIVMKAEEKIKSADLSRYYILTTHKNCSIVTTEVETLIDEIYEKYGCEVIVNGVIPTIKYYLRLLSNPLEVLNNYSDLLTTDNAVNVLKLQQWQEILLDISNKQPEQ